MSTDKDNMNSDKTDSGVSTLSSLKQQRTTMKRNITQMKTKIEKDGSTSDYTILECRLQILESYFKQISHIQAQIEKLDESDTNRSDIEELFISAKAPLVSFMNNKRGSCDIEQSFLNATQPLISHHNRLPQIKLPKFDGKYAEFSRFISTFNTLVHNESSIVTIDKFNYLLNCLSGQALAVIEPFQVVESNYQKAVDSLVERYDNKSLIFIDHINSLFSITPMTKPSASSLRSILDNVSALRSSLLSLGSELDVMNAIIIHIVLSKIDGESKKVYDEKQDFKSLPSWQQCFSILTHRCQYLESRNAEVDSFQPHDNKSRKGHFISQCPSKSRCRTCRISHHTTLHNPDFQSTTNSNTSSNQNQSNSNSQLQHNSTSNSSSQQPHYSSFRPSSSLSQQSVLPTQANPASTHLTKFSSFLTTSCRINLLPTAIVFVKDSFGSLQPLRALVDSCSEVNLITQESVNRLRLKQTKSTQEISGVSDIRTQLKSIVTATIRSRVSDFEWTTCFLVTKSISSQHPAEKINTTNWNIPNGLELADPQFHIPQRIDMLFSSEIFFELLLDGKISLGAGLPNLINTSLGWIIGGSVDSQRSERALSCNVITKGEDLNSLLKAFWEIEEFNQRSPVLTEEEQQCEDHFVKNTKFDADGKVQVCLPFKPCIKQLGSSFEIARKRLLYLEKRLSKDENLRQMYIDFMDEYIRLGHMSPVSFSCLNSSHYVIPHHPVLRPQSTTTKLRVVFDASCRTSTNISLNEALMVGPTIQQELIITILSFRLNKLALSADICKMYRQFLIDERDRNFQLILWRKNVHDPILLYQLNTVTYGTSAAPFLAVRSLFFIADFYKNHFSVGSKTLKQDLYVDDLLTGADNFSDLSRKKCEIVEILQKAGLQLSKWNSNCPNIASCIGERHLKTNEEYITKALGTSWRPNDDVFCFRFNMSVIEVPTKRSVLSAVAKIFDILGFLSPIVISCKILIQEMWKQNLDWDAPLNTHLSNRWKQIEQGLPYINKIEIPRFVGTSPQIKFDIHGFADASQLAYGCCIYIRVAHANDFKSILLIAKSRVAPVIHQSLPRLELCAALLLSKTWDKIKSKFNRFTYRIFFWSDSKIVLSWLSNHSSSYVCFVANRVSEIQNLTHNIKWKYVPSKQNPADIVSRGCLANDLIDTIWFTGPKFLSEPETNWPKGNTEKVELPQNEIRKTVLKTTVVVESIIDNLISRHSSYLRLLRIIIYIHRVFDKQKRNSFVTSEELQSAFYRIIYNIQQLTFKEEITSLNNGESLKPCFQKLAPFLDKLQCCNSTLVILRVGGRLANAPLSYETKFPALLPKDHRFTNIYIEYLHRKHLHAGPKALIGILRQQVWVINAREVVRKVVRNCVHCFKYNPRLLQQLMGNLPADRFKAQRPFLVSGVDFCGPFYTSYRIRGKAPYKTYVAIFVCFSSKAIHVELVSDLSTNTFLLCLKRFIGRRGIPQRLYCDNATNFVGASSKLQDLKQRFFDDSNIKELMHYSTITGFKFSFIPPRSPHFGGLWESAVKSTKTILVKNMSQANLTYEEFQTILVEVEAILNSRPLVPRSDDPNDGEALTPAHMLIGSSLMALPDENLDGYKNINYLKRWQLVTYLKQQFWILWVRDYVLNLQQRIYIIAIMKS
ncbi:uncharacterized protein LOC135964147 [Calliphora vicina]|uniref:uncharacterized protein LOC135964147 n=1 Tax=Calliphora vicina TaxID=7373 RepID=UPI00325B0E07